MALGDDPTPSSQFRHLNRCQGRRICEIVCVQNCYNLAHRADDAGRTRLAAALTLSGQVSAELDEIAAATVAAEH